MKYDLILLLHTCAPLRRDHRTRLALFVLGRTTLSLSLHVLLQIRTPSKPPDGPSPQRRDGSSVRRRR